MQNDRTDVANYYGSIYTHSIPWALHTKSVAKADQKDDKLPGNRIDRCLRNGQDGQTIGIPVGPDASFIIAELLLSAVDLKLQTEFPNLVGFRFFDDYELVCEDESESKRVLSALENVLGEYELQLNRRKTRIIALPDELDYSWLTELRRYQIGQHSGPNREEKQTRELIDFASTIFRLARQYNNDPVLHYALVYLMNSNLNITGTIWRTYQNILIQIYRSEPQLANLVAHQLLNYKCKGFLSLVSGKSYSLQKEI
jgi:hypothetical protein